LIREKETYDQIFILNKTALAEGIMLIAIKGFVTHVSRRDIIVVPETLSELCIFVGGALSLSNYSIVTGTLRLFITENSVMSFSIL